MKNVIILSLISVFIGTSTLAQKKSVWKEMNKEYEYCGSSLKLYDDRSFFYEEFCDATRFKFCLGIWEKRGDLIHLNPRGKQSFTLQVLEKKKSEFNGITVLDINYKPIPNFDFIQFPENVTPEEAVTDMDDYLSFTGKPNLTEISLPINSYEDGLIEPDFINENDQLLAYDLYQISNEKVLFNLKNLADTSYTVRINLPAEIFQYSDLEYSELPSNSIQLKDEGYKFVNKRE